MGLLSINSIRTTLTELKGKGVASYKAQYGESEEHLNNLQKVEATRPRQEPGGEVVW